MMKDPAGTVINSGHSLQSLKATPGLCCCALPCGLQMRTPQSVKTANLKTVWYMCFTLKMILMDMVSLSRRVYPESSVKFPSAHWAAFRTKGEASSKRDLATGFKDASPLFPTAIRTFRTKRSRPVRLSGEPEKKDRKPASSSAAKSAKRGAVNSVRGKNALSRVGLANLFQGHTDKQSSQP